MAPINPSDILLRVTGKPRYGVATRRLTTIARGGEQLQETFSRPDAATCATFIGIDGKLYTAAANKLRIEWVDLDGDGIRETPGLSLEGSRTNALTKSEKLDDAVWTKTRATISADAATAPNGISTADKLVEDATASTTHFLIRGTAALTDNTKQPWSVFAKAAERTWIALRFQDKSNTFKAAYFNLSTGGLGTVDAGVDASIQRLANGWMRCSIAASAASGATSPSVLVNLSTGDGVISYSGDGASGVYLWGLQLEIDKVFPSSYIATDASTVTRAADSLTVPVPFGVQDLTVFARIARPVWADAVGDIGGFSPSAFGIGNSAPGPQLRGGGVSGVRNWFGYIDTAGSDSNQSTPIPAIALHSVAWQFKSLTTAPQVALDVGGGLTAFASAATAFSSFNGQVLNVGRYASGQELYGVLLDLVLCAGLRSLTEMLAIP